MGLILGVDGGNSKTALLAATTEGELVASLRGPGTNTHAVGPGVAVQDPPSLGSALAGSMPRVHHTKRGSDYAGSCGR